MDPRILDASTFIIYAIWIAVSLALIGNLAQFARRAQRVRSRAWRRHDR